MLDLKRVRKKAGLTEAEFLTRLKPALKSRKAVLTLDMLQRVEAGEELEQLRMAKVNESIAETFPDIVTNLPERKSYSFSISRRSKYLILFTLLSVVAVFFYFFFGLGGVLIDLIGILVAISALFAWYSSIKDDR